MLAAVAVGQYEFYRMAQARGSHPLQVLGIALGALIVLEFYHPLVPALGTFLPVAASALLIMVARLFSPRPVDGAIEDVASTFLGVFYVAMLFAFQVGVRTGEDGKQWLVFLYFIIWASDIGAYSIGIPFGKHRLYEKVSPKKSIEGLLGALVASAAMALLCRVWFMPPIGMGEAIAIALAAGGCRDGRRPGGVAVQARGRGQGLGSHHPRSRRDSRPHGQHAVRRAGAVLLSQDEMRRNRKPNPRRRRDS